MDYNKKLIELYDKVGGVNASWIETFKNVTEPITEPLSDERVNQLVEDLDNMADWNYDIKDVREIVAFERKIQEKFEEKFEKLEQMVERLAAPDKIENFKVEFEPLFDAIERSYLTLGSNFEEYRNRVYTLTEE